MPDLAQLLRDGSTNLWLFVPSAILLGAFHGLEPGHSKTMMAAFIIAVRGTVGQAVLLGLSATPGRTWNNPVADEELAIFFKRNKVTLKIEGYDNPVDYLVKEGYLAKITNNPLLYKGGIAISEKDIEYLNSYLQLPESFLKNLSEDKQYLSTCNESTYAHQLLQQ